MSGHPNRRHEIPGHCRFMTFSCRHRLPLFTNEAIKHTFVTYLAEVRDRLGFRLVCWVVMPEHVHLLILPRLPEQPMARTLTAIKRPFAERVLSRWRRLDAPVLERITEPSGRARFWQPGGGYDRNIFTLDELTEKINYTHFNPVRRGLVKEPTAWRWSSARWYAGDRSDTIAIDRVWEM